MDSQRFQELERKRDTEGLSDEEANELGRMMAEQRGQPYQNADTRQHPDAGPHAWKTAEGVESEEGLQEPPAGTSRPAATEAGGLAAEKPEEGRDTRDPGP